MSGKADARNPNAGKSNKILLAVGAVVIIVLLIIIGVLLAKGSKTEEPKRNVVVTPDNVESVMDDMATQEYVEPGYYSASMSNVWHFTAGDAVSEDAYVANLAENTNDVYFDVFLADNEDEAILESPVIPRGSQLDNIALDKSLSAGTYDCVMIYHLVDGDQNTVGTLRVGFTIIVEN